MPQELEIKVSPEMAQDETKLLEILKSQIKNSNEIKSIHLLKKSIDARKQPIVFVLRYIIYFNSDSSKYETLSFKFQQTNSTKKVAIIGTGPAGLFAALQLIEKGIKPMLFERGKNVKERRRDLAALNKELIVNPESNYCFGEGGAGTYSDGKLYTRSKKRGDVEKVLNTFVQHGAASSILYDAHPHIGTNKLPNIIENIRETIENFGGEFHFNSKLTDFIINDKRITKIEINNDALFDIDEVILATGHSARDIFELLHSKQIQIEAKPFALGVRIEHPQPLIDEIQYKCKSRGEYLPPSSYSLVTQALGHGVFSFCMCPGGIIAPASTNINETIVNGWSPSKRNGNFANSGMVVTVNEADWVKQFGNTPLSALAFQKQVEQKAYNSTNSIIAPAQRLEDFIQNKTSNQLPECSYIPGVLSRDLKSILPTYIHQSLSQGLIDFGKKMKGYRTNEAILVGVESRTSSPVRIPRDKLTNRHPQIYNLIPCGEGAGYAGGIVSAALDGISCANSI